MHQSPISKQALLFSLLFSVFITGIIVVSHLGKQNTIIVFCDVGQGDGAYIRIQNKIDVIIDAGPDNGMMLSCLGKYMPFFDKQIEIAILSHPQSDHYGGLKSIVDRYKIKQIYISHRDSSNKPFSELLHTIVQQQGQISIIRAGETISVLHDVFYFYWPPSYLINHQGVSLIKNSDGNIYSSIFSFTEKENTILFTGDTPSSLLTHIIKSTHVLPSILKVSHHGSKTGTTQELISLAHPSLAVISVGSKNRYGHPSKNVLDIFKALKIPVRRTDKEGDIVIRFP